MTVFSENESVLLGKKRARFVYPGTRFSDQKRERVDRVSGYTTFGGALVPRNPPRMFSEKDGFEKDGFEKDALDFPAPRN